MSSDGSAARAFHDPVATITNAVSSSAWHVPLALFDSIRTDDVSIGKGAVLGKNKMLTVTTASIWGITVALGAAAAALVAGDGRSQNESHLVQQACAGLASSRQVEDALASIRGLSNDGFDPVCTTLAIESTRLE